MRHRHTLVVALEEGEKILREIVLVDVGERTDNPEIECDVLAVMHFVTGDKNIAGVHVGMEEAVAENLREEDLDPGARQCRQIDPGGGQRCGLADRNAVHAFHDHHCRRAVIPIHAWHQQQFRTQEIAPKL